MKSIRDAIEVKQRWSKSEYNRWTDFIELKCLLEEIVSDSDMIDIWNEGDLDNDLQRGESGHHEKADRLEARIHDYFGLSEARLVDCDTYYPFELEDSYSIQLVDIVTPERLIYIYLLVCSSISLMEKSEMQKCTKNFEQFCKIIMEKLVPEDAVVELFGTSKDGSEYTGNLRRRIEKLASNIGAKTSDPFNSSEKYDNIYGGDDGLDIVSYFPIDNAQFIPFSFAQCTCSYENWVNKQYSISFDRWHKKIEPLVYYGKYMFVPFSCHDSKEKFYDPTDISTFLIDRIRMIKIIEKDENLKERVIKHCELFLSESETFQQLMELLSSKK